jgi:hypothetical protein
MGVWLEDRVEIEPILTAIGWRRVVSGGGFLKGTYGYTASIYRPRRAHSEDAPPEAAALLSSVNWFLEAGLEGSSVGQEVLLEAVEVIARAGRGVIVDYEAGTYWLPGEARHEWTRHRNQSPRKSGWRPIRGVNRRRA